ncbi:Tex family protein [Streptococcus sp. zg-JUN1979]|uniref:Tex family protein n=1 Tax=Streptococcus sp. zg-JUN1979 TaxID=3391450 RepID=UPI0039A5B723
MENATITAIAQELGLNDKQVSAVLNLTKEGNTIPFIARYRKEATGNLDEVVIKTIIDKDKLLTALSERRETILAKIEEQGKLTKELKTAIFEANTLATLEDLYLPYKEKRRTKATIAKEAGLLGLARLILQNDKDLEDKAATFCGADFDTVAKALSGAVDILIEAMADDPNIRSFVYRQLKQYGLLTSQVKDDSLDEQKVFSIYYDFQEKVEKLQGYRVLALNRGEKLGILKVAFSYDIDIMIRFVGARFKERNTYIDKAIIDALKKKVIPAMERRIRTELTETAEEGAISVFTDNLRHLLLTSPLKDKMVLGFDPAFRTGAKLAVVEPTGKLVETQVIYPVAPADKLQIEQAKKDLAQLLARYDIDIIAIGNGTASRESEAFVAEVLKDFPQVSYVIVNESGASVYSASELAREEFPDLTVEKRSAISIARRLQDPLAELVKIDPKSIGVGQYQHDVNQKKLAENLDFVVETVVNQVGVNLNTASSALLEHVSGLSKTIATNIVAYREENGNILSRDELHKIPRLGTKAFEQAAGFLRIPESSNILDNTGVHPERYPFVERLLADNGITSLDDKAKDQLLALSNAIDDLAIQYGIGVETLKDIMADLVKPGRDLRDDFAAPKLRQDVLDISDLELHQQLEGTVRNVVDFGAFVDIGLHDDGLIHISQMSKSFISHPSQVVSVGDIVTVWVSKIDRERQKINLSLLNPHESH